MAPLSEPTLWLMEPRALQRAARRAFAQPCPSPRDLVTIRHQRLADVRQAAARTTERGAGVPGVIGIHGPIQQRLTAELLKNDGTSCEEISAALDYLLEDRGVSSIVLHIDSPGGSSYGVEELAEKIRNAASQKPVYAIADSMAASAAYWLGSAASEFYVTPGGDVGSVGVYMMHIDESAALEDEGIRVSFVSAGRHKVEGNPFEPLSEEARGYWQEQVDYTMAKFVGALARFRNVADTEVRGKPFGEGRVLNPTQALAARMVDGVMSFEQLMGKLMNTAKSVPVGPSVDVLRARQEQRKRAAVADEEEGGLKEGAKVTFKEGMAHPPFEEGVEYVVRQVSTPALGLATADAPDMVLRWATEGELDTAGGSEPAPAEGEEAPAEVPA